MAPPRISPLAKKIAKERGIAPENLIPSGAGDRIMSRDIPEAEPEPRRDKEPEEGPSPAPPRSDHEVAGDNLGMVGRKINAAMGMLGGKDCKIELKTRLVHENDAVNEVVTIRITRKWKAKDDRIDDEFDF